MDYVTGTLIGASADACIPYVVIATATGHRVCWLRNIPGELERPRQRAAFWGRHVGATVVASVEPLTSVVVGFGMDFA